MCSGEISKHICEAMLMILVVLTKKRLESVRPPYPNRIKAVVTQHYKVIIVESAVVAGAMT